jgi:hypothetical protein
LKNAKEIGIYGVYENPEQFGGVIKFAKKLKRQGKIVRLLIYYPEYQEIKETSLSIEPLQFDQTGFAKFPIKKAVEVQHFICYDFDILFDTSLSFHYVDVSVMCASKAKFKVGKSGEWNSRVNDFSMSFKDGTGQEEALQIMVDYLKIF